MHRVIQQCPLSSPNAVFIGAGVGRGQVLAQKLMKAGVGRGQVLAKKLVKEGVGKGQSVPSSKATRPEECRGHVDASTSADIPPPITMRLDHQGPPVLLQPLRPPWTILNDRNGMSKPPEERKRNVSPKKLTSTRPSEDW